MSLDLDKSNWKRVRLGDVIRRSRKQADPIEAGVERYVAGGHIDSDSIIVERWGVPTDGQMGSTFRYVFEPGQILFVSARPYLRKMGVVGFSGVVADKTYVLDAIPENGLLQEFLPFVLASDRFVEYANTEATGSMNPRLLWGPLQRYEFELPPPDDQKRIADLLWALERERAAQVGLLLRLDDVSAALAEKLTARTSEIQLLGDVLETILDRRGITPKKLGGDFVEDGVPVLSAMNVVDGQIDRSRQERYVTADLATRWMAGWLHEGDILMTSEAPLGSTVLLGRDMQACIGQRLFVLRPDQRRVLPAYLYAWLSSAAGQSALGARASGTTVKGIRQAELVKIELPVPALRLQQEFIEEWSALRRAKATVQSQLAPSRVVSESVLRDLFGGN